MDHVVSMKIKSLSRKFCGFFIIDTKRQLIDSRHCSYLAESVEVSRGGSYISVIHGTSTQTMVNRTNSVAVAFEQLRNFTDPCKIKEDKRR